MTNDSAEQSLSDATIAEARNGLRSALELIDIQATRIGHDLEAEGENLRELVTGKDEATQKQIGLLFQSVGELDRSLSSVRENIVKGLSALETLQDELPEREHSEEKSENADESDHEPHISAREAGHVRHDEPVTVSSIIRSLLMADEPGQRERRGTLNDEVQD